MRPLGNLYAFGSYIFFPHRAIPVSIKDEVTPAYAPVVGRVYPIDRLGNAVAALGNSSDGAQYVYDWHIVAQDYNPVAGLELLAVETQLNLLRAFLVGTNVDGTSMAVQTLQQYSGDKVTVYTASARLIKLDIQELVWDYGKVELTFIIRGEFA